MVHLAPDLHPAEFLESITGTSCYVSEMNDAQANTTPTLDTARTYLVYDGDCPACRHYVRFVRFRDAVGVVELINAREANEWVAHLRLQGMPLDDGMVLVYAGRYFHGADAIHQMALLANRSGGFNRATACLFQSRRLTGFLYPILKTLRNALLWTLRRSKIDS